MNEAPFFAISNSSTNQETPDQLNLVDIWFVLVRRKFLILAVFALIMLTVGTALLILPSRYESVSVIAVGQLAATGEARKETSLEQPETMVERLKQQYRVDDRDLDRSLPHLSYVGFSLIGSKQVVTLRALGSTPEAANDYLGKVVKAILEEHQKLYEDASRVQRERLTALNFRLSKLRQEIKKFDDRGQQLKALDPAAAVLVLLERAKLEALEPVLINDRSLAELALLPPNSEATRFLKEPTMPTKAKSPRPELYLAVAAVFGLVLSVFAAFFGEFFARISKEVAYRRKQLAIEDVLDNRSLNRLGNSRSFAPGQEKVDG